MARISKYPMPEAKRSKGFLEEINEGNKSHINRKGNKIIIKFRLKAIKACH